MVKITGVDTGSLAERAGARAGDILVSINGREIDDVLDYRFRLCEKRVTLTLERGSTRFNTVIRKGEDDTDIGLLFETPLMDGKHSCRNKCIFCFIDQNPRGMRQSCYFKDDDSRLSFLHGNYITMTNLTPHEIDRIIEMHISPLNVSVHTTDPELRVKMMGNPHAGEVLSYLRRFADAGLRICAQIVLCRGVNDGQALDRTMADLVGYYPSLDSVSVVPAGLTSHREGLYPLSPFTPDECRAVIAQVTSFGDKCREKYGSRLFYCADELYIKAGLPMPDAEYYEEYSQLENGVGMLTAFREEYERELEYLKNEKMPSAPRRVSIATGYAAYDEICRLSRLCEAARDNLSVHVFRIKNCFFGESVTVSGLLTGGDIARGVDRTLAGDLLYFPPNALRDGGDLFLDGMTPDALADVIGTRVTPSPADGGEFVRTICGL